MKKKFHITGVCYPQLHYMMDNKTKLDQIIELIEFGTYFTINRPCQFEKTTTLHSLTEKLQQTEEYLAIRLTFENVIDSAHTSDNAFAQMFITKMGISFLLTLMNL